jgi:peptide/nickel transport system permease protein
MNKKMMKMLYKRKTAFVGSIIILLVIITALFAPFVAPYDPNLSDLDKRLMPPSWEEDGSQEHLLGTDHLGRDLLSRIIYGTRISLLVGIITVLLSGIFGTVLGLLGGFYRGFIDSFLMRLTEVQLAFPFILLALAIMSVLGPGLRNVILVLSITGWVMYSRLVRGEVLLLRELEYVKAAKALGQKNRKIIFGHILPNVFPTIVVVGTLRVANMIIAEASLTFLGLGVESSIPTWGSMLADGRNYITSAWWVATFPGIAIMLTVLGINLVGDWLRDVLDPRLRTS